jgi:hypothetical protein
MSVNILDKIDILGQTTPATGQDLFTQMMSMPVTKLDADQYTAEDLDGVTESIFGSGNLNFMMLQAAQTNEAITISDPFNVLETGDVASAKAAFSATSFPAASIYVSNSGNESNNDLQTNTGRILEEGNDIGIAGHNADNGFSAISASTFGAHGLTGHGPSGFSGAADFSSPLNMNNSQAQNGQNGQSGINGINGTNGSGINVVNEITNVVNEVTNLLEEVINLGDTIGDSLITEVTEVINNLPTLVTEIKNLLEETNITDILNQTILGDTVTNITEGTLTFVTDVTEITNEITETVTNFLDDILNEGDITTTLTNLINNPETLLTTITDLVENADILTQVTNTINHVTDIADDLLGNGNGTDEEVHLTSDINLGIIDTSFLDPVLDIVEDNALRLDTIEDLVGDIDLDAGLGIDLFSQNGNETDNSAGDSDLTLGSDLNLIGNNLLGEDAGLSLDPLEDITGDIDLDLGIGGDLLGNLADSIVNDGEGGNGENPQVAQLGDTLSDAASSVLDNLNGSDSDGNDLFIDTDNGLTNSDLLNVNADIVLDPLENIFGQDIDVDTDNIVHDLSGNSEIPDINLADDLLDIDSLMNDLESTLNDTLNNATDLLDNVALGGGLGELPSEGDASDILSWPENILPDAGDILGGGDNGLDSILPDPVGHVSEGLGGLLGNDNHQSSGNSGGHQGGLFGGLFG